MSEFVKTMIWVVAGPVATLCAFFMWGWIGHTNTVQSWVASDIAEFKKKDIDWSYFNIDQDRDAARKELIGIITDINNILAIQAFRDEQRSYRDRIYDLIYVYVNSPDDLQAVKQAARRAQTAQEQYYSAADRFVNKKLYAMLYTF